MNTAFATWLGTCTVTAALLLAACGDDDAASVGEPGAPGAPGVAGPPGAPGAAGPAGPGAALPDAGFGSAACTAGCHTMGGVVEQWRFSNHSHPQESEVGTGACGNCHGVDALSQRLAGSYGTAPDAGAPSNVEQGHLSYRAANGSVGEIAYGGATVIGRIHCTTCHDFNPSTDPHVTGSYAPRQAPVRVPSGPADTAYVEASPAGATTPVGQPVSYGLGNMCVYCHKSRKDVTLYITASNSMSSTRWGPHNGPQADLYSGLGGYAFAGQTYSGSAHQTLGDACVSCHMQPVESNGNMPDHTMKPALTLCKTCHTQYSGSNFDVNSGQSRVRAALSELEALLDQAGLLTRSSSPPYQALQPEELADDQFHLDSPRPGSGGGGANQVLTAPRAGALYNFLVIARGKDYGVHNPVYTKQLLWDSIVELKGSNPTSMPGNRPQ